jgi:hypothetical protein
MGADVRPSQTICLGFLRCLDDLDATCSRYLRNSIDSIARLSKVKGNKGRVPCWTLPAMTWNMDDHGNCFDRGRKLNEHFSFFTSMLHVFHSAMFPVAFTNKHAFSMCRWILSSGFHASSLSEIQREMLIWVRATSPAISRDLHSEA